MSQKSIAKGSLYLLIAQVIFMASGYIIHFGLARILGPALYGVYGIVLSLISIINIIVTSGASQAISKYISAGENAEIIKRTSLKFQSFFALIIFCLYELSAGIFAKLLGDLNLIPYIRIAGFIPLAYALYTVYVGYFNGLREFKKQAWLQIVYSLSKLFFTFILVYLGFSLFGAFIGFAVGPLIGFLMGMIISGIGEKNKFEWQKLVSFAWPIIVFSVVLAFLVSIDLFSVKAILGENTSAGFYNAATTLARVPYTILSVIASVLFPSISYFLSKKDFERVKYYIEETLRYLILLLIPATFLIAGTAKNLISLIYSTEYLPAAGPLIILIFGFAFLTIFNLLATIIIANGKPKVSMVMILGLAIISLILNILLIPIYGLNGAAFSTTIACFVGLILSSVYILKNFKVLMNWKSFLKILVASLIIFCFTQLWAVKGIILLVEYGILFLIYFGLLFLFKEINKNDIKIVKELIPRNHQK
ncbi:MAG: flippase [Candidatus Pacebacteria bacterium]|nr:flippase [Candidatus Paceibacterota bacterium]